MARRVKPELPAGALAVGAIASASVREFASLGTIDGRLALQEYVNALVVDFDNADTGSDGVSLSPLVRLGAEFSRVKRAAA